MKFLKAIAGAVLFLSCYISAAQNITIVSPMPGSYIHIIKPIVSSVTGESTLDTVYVGTDSVIYKKNTEYLLVLLKKDNFKSKSFLINDKIVKDNKKRVKLEILDSIPQWSKVDCRLRVDEVNLNVDAKNFKTRFYEEYDDYLKNTSNYTSSSNGDLKIKNSILSDQLNEFLIKAKYIDTSQSRKLNLNVYEQVDMDIDITNINYVMFPNYYFVEIKCKVLLSDFFASNKAINKEYTVRSNMGRSTDDKQNAAIFVDALENLLVTMLKDPAVAPNFINLEDGIKKKMAAMEVLELRNTSTNPPSLENAVNSVVTVKLANGHGSGCIISNDGYIVTNYHVLSSDTADAQVLLNNGSKMKCRYVRGNPIYDLALLKIDTVIAEPLKVSGKPATLGSDAFAIGTPKDISLGQTITKGIISAKRTLQNKVYLQSDVSVNGGNSGGALTNKDGELIGIVNAKLVGVGVEGVSFSIPVSYIEEALKVKVVTQ